MISSQQFNIARFKMQYRIHEPDSLAAPSIALHAGAYESCLFAWCDALPDNALQDDLKGAPNQFEVALEICHDISVEIAKLK